MQKWDPEETLIRSKPNKTKNAKKKPYQICSMMARAKPDSTSHEGPQEMLWVSHDSPPFWKPREGLGEGLQTYWHHNIVPGRKTR